MKYYVFRINKNTSEKHYMKTKCREGWSKDKQICWQFSKQGAAGIAGRYSAYTNPMYTAFDYGVEPVHQALS